MPCIGIEDRSTWSGGSLLRGRIAPVVGLAVVVAIPLVDQSLMAYAVSLVMYVALAIGWNLQGGYVGDLSFGHVAFFGLGGYTCALLVNYHILDWSPLNILVGGIVAAVFAAVVGLPFLRLKGFYFAIGTLGLASLLLLLFANVLAPLTHGEAGIVIPPPTIFHVQSYYYQILGIALGAGAISVAVVRSRVGLAFQAIRDNPEAARTLGINVTFYRVLAFALSAFIVGVVGGFFAYYTSYVLPEGMFDTTISFEMLVMVYFGGAGTLTGPVVGAAVLYAVEQGARNYVGQGYYILPAAVLVAVFVFMPTGIVGALRRLRPAGKRSLDSLRVSR